MARLSRGAQNVSQAIDALDNYFDNVRTQVKSMMDADKGLNDILHGIDLEKYAK